MVNNKISFIYAFVTFKIKSTFLTPEKITHCYQNQRLNTWFIVKYFGSKYDVYKTNAGLYGRWCFITLFQISRNTKKTLLEM